MHSFRLPLINGVSARKLGIRFFAVRPFKLPDIGEGIAEVQIMEWFVKEGDRVKEMDKLCLVESDKASVEITSRYHGVVKKILAPQHQQAKVGSVIIEIDDGEASSAGDAPPVEEAPTIASSSPPRTPPTAPSRPTSSDKQSSVKAIPAVRELAKRLKVDLSQVKGTGKDGRITEDDVRGIRPPSESLATDKEVKLGQVGIAMVKSMTESLKVPQLTHSDGIECEKLYHLIKLLKPIVKQSHALPNLTITAFLIKAVSLGISEFPIVNSRLSEAQDAYILQASHNVSVAMDSPRGLVVPNIKNVQNLSVIEIQELLLALQERAHAGRLTLDDIRGGTISLSNVGVIGGTYTKPILFANQSVIGAVGRMHRIPRFLNDASDTVVSKRIMNVSWSADHRHVDGASVARFSNVFKQHVEDPEIITALHFK